MLRRLTELYPRETAFRHRLIKFYIEQHREADGEQEVRAIVAANPGSPEAELDLVRFLDAVKSPAAARQELVARIGAGGEVFPYQIALAEFDFAESRVADAERLLQDLARRAGPPEQALTAQIKLAQMYLNANQVDAADTLVSEILPKNSGNVEILRLRASDDLARGKPEIAVASLRQALDDQPQSIEIMLQLALAYERSGSIALADKQYADAVRASNFNPIAGLDYVGFLTRRGSSEHAEEVLTELRKRSPKNLQILSALAQVKLNRGDWSGAQTLVEPIRGAGDAHGLADQVLGAALIGQHKYDEGIAVFQSAVDASPSGAQPMESLVSALVRVQRTDDAMAFLKSTLTANPDNTEALMLMGSVQLATGAPDQASESFRSAIKKQPMNVAGYQALAHLYFTEKKIDQAFEVIRSGLQARPGDINLHLTMASLFEKSGQYEAAIAEYESILSRQPGSMVAANNLASLLSEHRTDNASLERAQSLAAGLEGSQVPQFKDTLGWVHYRRGDYGGAVPLLEQAAAARPNNAVIHYHLAMGYIAIREAAKASEQLKTALSLTPDSELEEKIQDALKKLAT